MIDNTFDAVPLKLMQKLGPKQVAFVVRDIEASAKTWWDVLRIGPWTAWEYTPQILKEMTYKGAPAEFGLKHALAWKDGVQFELVQPTTGPSFFADQLNSSGEGLNHIGIHVMENHAQAVERNPGSRIHLHPVRQGLWRRWQRRLRLFHLAPTQRPRAGADRPTGSPP